MMSATVIELRRIVSGQPDVVETYAYKSLGALSVNAGAPVDHQRPRLDDSSASSAGIPNTYASQPLTLNVLGQVQRLQAATLSFTRRGRLQTVTDGANVENYTRNSFMQLLSRTRNGIPEEYRYDYHTILPNEPAESEPLGNIVAQQDYNGGAVQRRFFYEDVDKRSEQESLISYCEQETVRTTHSKQNRVERSS